MHDGVPPASPSERDAEVLVLSLFSHSFQHFPDVVFLIGGYAKYKSPFVWVRSNHTKLLDTNGSTSKPANKDTPLELNTTTNWKTDSLLSKPELHEELRCWLCCSSQKLDGKLNQNRNDFG